MQVGAAQKRWCQVRVHATPVVATREGDWARGHLAPRDLPREVAPASGSLRSKRVVGLHGATRLLRWSSTPSSTTSSIPPPSKPLRASVTPTPTPPPVPWLLCLTTPSPTASWQRHALCTRRHGRHLSGVLHLGVQVLRRLWLHHVTPFYGSCAREIERW